jgi:hypothetical protein
MGEAKVLDDREGTTLTVWFTERSHDDICEETAKQLSP